MQIIFGFLATILGIYSLLIIIRIILTWFSSIHFGRPVQLLARITDPYLNWWRRTVNLRVGFLDLSPLVGMAVLSVAQTIFRTIARQGEITLGIIFGICLSALWSIVSFLLGLCIVVLGLRLIAYAVNANLFSPFWQVIDSISRPLLYRISRVIFGKRIVHFVTGIITAIAVIVLALVIGRIVIGLITGLLLPPPQIIIKIG